MADDDLGPETLTTRGVPSARRGYDRRVIDAILSQASDRWQKLQDEHDELKAAVEKSGGLEFLGRELGAIGKEVGAILASAQEAADGLRTRAREEAERLEGEASEAVEAELSEAQRHVFDLRKDAWETGMDLLESAAAEAARIISDGKEDALLIRAQAEKEGHKRLAATEREATDIVRNARYEADRQLNQAREMARRMIDRAAAPSMEEDDEAAGSKPEPVSEERRRELIEEIERLRAQRSIASVEVFATEPRATAVPDTPAVEPDGIDLSDVMAAEAARLRGEPEVIKVRVDPPAETAAFGTNDDVGTLFEALRTTGETERVVVEEQLPTDPFELRDQLLLPVINAGVRGVKRRIVDLQNIALDGLRGSGWEPHPPGIAEELRATLEPMVHKAGSAGAKAAGPLAGIFGALSDPGDRAGSLVGGIAAALSGQLSASLEDTSGPEPAAEAVSRVFRHWRNDDAERWVRLVATAAYHDSLLAALSSGGVGRVVAIPSGSPCDECPGPAGSTWRPGRRPPKGTKVPPAHLNCACTFAADG